MCESPSTSICCTTICQVWHFYSTMWHFPTYKHMVKLIHKVLKLDSAYHIHVPKYVLLNQREFHIVGSVRAQVLPFMNFAFIFIADVFLEFERCQPITKSWCVYSYRTRYLLAHSTLCSIYISNWRILLSFFNSQSQHRMLNLKLFKSRDLEPM